MKLVESMSRMAQLGQVELKGFDDGFDGTMYLQQDENGIFWVKETSQGLGDGGWEWGVNWNLGGSDGGTDFPTAQDAFNDMVETLYAEVRTAREGDGDCVTDFALPYDYDETEHQRVKSYIEDEKKAARDFKVAQEIEELTDAADQFFDDEDGVPAGQIAKAEWVASRMAERRLAKRVGDGVLNHLASMGSTTGLLACARLSDRKAFDEYKAEFEHRAKHASRKPLLKTKEARFKAWASRKIAFNGDCEVFIGAVSNPTNGDWLKLPASDSEIDDAIERAQTGPDGEYYEEVMISDTSGLGNSVGEYDDIRSVNEWVEAIEDAGLDDDLIEALLDEYDLEYVADNIENVDYWPDVSDDEDLGYRIVDELGFDGISDDAKKMYFDYESFGRDIVINDGYTIDNGFAYRVASRTALACDMHDRMLVSLFERNVREKVEGKVKTEVKTCGKMIGSRG
jgi:antirestriction protein